MTELAFATYDWRSGGGLAEDDFAAARKLAHDVFLCCTAATLAEAGQPQYELALSGTPPSLLLSRPVYDFVNALGQWAFTRFAFRKAMAHVAALPSLGDASRRAYASYERPTLRRREITAAEADEVWHSVAAFLDRTLTGPAFAPLFLLPLRGPLTGVSRDDYDRFLTDFAAVSRRVVELLGTHGAWSIFSFWITRMQTANVWHSAGEAEELRTLCSSERRAMLSFNEDGGWIDYFVADCGEMATAMLRESARELYFPVTALRGRFSREESNAWLGDDFIERAWTANFDIENHPKGKHVIDACREYRALEQLDEPLELSLSRDQVLTTQRYLTGFTRKHFLGHFAEMFALPLVLRAFGDRLTDDMTCVPGTALHLGRMGPDAIIGTIRRDGTDVHAHVHAIVEVKGYEPRRNEQRDAIVAQLQKHRRRLTREQLSLTCTRFDEEGRWALPRDGRHRVTVDRCTIADDALLIAVTPALPTGADRFGGAVQEVAMPWTGDGIREMAEGFLRTTLRLIGQKVDGDADSTLGLDAWAEAVRPHVDDARLTAELRRSMRKVSEPAAEVDRFHLASLT